MSNARRSATVAQDLGALEMRLRDSGYDYRFHPAPGEREYADSGSADCV